MPPVPRQPPAANQRPPKGEQQRIVDDQVAGFQRDLYAHELNVTRLEALPAELRDGGYAEQLEGERRAIAVLQSAIDSTRSARPT